MDRWRDGEREQWIEGALGDGCVLWRWMDGQTDGWIRRES